MAQVMIAQASALVTVDGREEWVRRDRTLAHDDHPVVTKNPDLWRLLPVNYPSPAPDALPDVEVAPVDDAGTAAIEPNAAGPAVTTGDTKALNPPRAAKATKAAKASKPARVPRATKASKATKAARATKG